MYFTFLEKTDSIFLESTYHLTFLENIQKYLSHDNEMQQVSLGSELVRAKNEENNIKEYILVPLICTLFLVLKRWVLLSP